MKTRWFSAALALVLAVSLSPDLAEAKRLGSGKNTGMQRQAPPQAAPQTPPPQAPAAPAAAAGVAGKPAAAAAAAAAPAKRSWMGPLAGLAAGLGLAALFSAMGMGEAFGSFMLMLLMAVVAFFAIRFIMSRMRGGSQQPALATAGAAAGGSANGSAPWASQAPQAPVAAEPMRFDTSNAASSGSDVSVTGQPLRPIQIGEALGSPAVMATGVAAGPLTLPEGFDLPAFERVAKMIFIRLQAANDKADLDDLRQFTTPEMFAAVRLDLQDRNSAAQHTDVERVDAELIDFSQEEARHVASVRFKGLIVEEKGSPAVAFDEIWHLVKALDGSSNWAIAGIQQPQ